MKLTKEQLEQAREWLADCTWPDVEDSEEFWTEFSDEQIERGIERHFGGGLKAFIETCN